MPVNTMVNNMNELKKCPFCGGKFAVVRNMHDEFCFYIECTLCDSTGPEGDDEREAIAAWNRRANSE